MKNIKLGLLLILTLSIFIFSNVQTIFAGNADTLVVHYHRYDDREDEFELWLWAGALEGNSYSFNGTDSYGVTATVDISSTNLDGYNSVGVIVRSIGGWTERDGEIDRFIDMTNPNGNGEVHVYLLQTEDFISYVLEDTPSCNRDVFNDPYNCAQVIGVRLLDAYFNNSLDVYFMTSVVVDSSDITILKEGVSVSFTGFSSGTSGTLTIIGGVDVSKKYEISIDLGTEIVTNIIRFGDDYDSVVFNNAYNYNGELGFLYSSTETTFKLWAPVSSEVELNLYSAGHSVASRVDGVDNPYLTIPMVYLEKGVWEVTVLGDLHGVYYTYNVTNSGSKVSDIPDPYGQTFGLNGKRAMVIDFDQINPIGWDIDTGINGYTNINDSIIYELHVRDLTTQDSWGGPSEYSGTYMGFTVSGTTFTNPYNDITVTTGLDHLVELGITHVHLLPTYDQDSWNDENNFVFNWGYNPEHYNSPEGGYSTNPFDGSVRVNEYKQMVMALHDNGINVILDVVYNHTGNGSAYCFNKIVPDYFFRLNPDGSYSNGSGVGNETASERYMVSKYIVDSVKMWAEEYHIDGFRFDLMAIHDVATMNTLASELELIDEDIFVYGEPWGGGTIALDYNLQAGKNNLTNMPLISAFNDGFRDAIKGSTWDANGAGYVTNSAGIAGVKYGISGSDNWGLTSSQTINYVSAHDNLTLYDKLLATNSASGYTEEVDYQARLANSIVMFSQGVPFLHAGVDFLRTKGGNHNSYDASDLVNQLNWVRKSTNIESFEYYKGIIEIRKAYESFKMTDESDIAANLTFLNPEGYGMIGYNLTKNNEDILVYHNGGKYTNDVSLPAGAWMLISDQDKAGLVSLGTFAVRYPIEKAETLVFVKGHVEDIIDSPFHSPEITNIIGVMFEGGEFVLGSNTEIAEYQINNGEYIVLDTPSTFVKISDLVVGDYEFRVKDIYGGISDIFSLTVLENTTTELTCEEDPTQDKCQVDPLTCEEDPTQDKCQTEPPTCDEDPTQDRCQEEPVDENKTVIIVIAITTGVGGLGAGLYFIRKLLL